MIIWCTYEVWFIVQDLWCMMFGVWYIVKDTIYATWFIDMVWHMTWSIYPFFLPQCTIACMHYKRQPSACSIACITWIHSAPPPYHHSTAPQYFPLATAATTATTTTTKAWTQKSSSGSPVFGPSQFRSASLHNGFVAPCLPADRKTRPVNAIPLGGREKSGGEHYNAVKDTFGFACRHPFHHRGKREACWKQKWQKIMRVNLAHHQHH